MQDLQEQVAALTENVKKADEQRLRLEEENRSLREALAMLPAGKSPAEIREEWSQTELIRAEEEAAARRRESQVMQAVESIRETPFWHPLRRWRATLRIRNLGKLLTGETES
jgi:hypothetical protein